VPLPIIYIPERDHRPYALNDCRRAAEAGDGRSSTVTHGSSDALESPVRYLSTGDRSRGERPV